MNRHSLFSLWQRLQPEIRVVASESDERAVGDADKLLVPNRGEDLAIETAQGRHVSGRHPQEEMVYRHADLVK